MTYSLNIWRKPNSDEVRIYLGGTTRQSIYLKRATDGRIVWSSKANDTPTRFRTGDHYGKIRKDGAAASEVAEAFGVTLGEAKAGEEDWSRLVGMAEAGIQIGAREE